MKISEVNTSSINHVSYHSTEGYLIPAGPYDSEPVFNREGVRAEKEIVGADFTDNGTSVTSNIQTARLVDDNNGNKYRALIHQAYCRLLALHYKLGLLFTPSQYSDYALEEAINWVELVNMAASGDGTTINATLPVNIANFTATRDTPISITPGSCCAISNNRTAYVLNLTFTSATTISLTLDRRLNCNTTSGVTLAVENVLYRALFGHLHPTTILSPFNCIHSIEANHTTLSSWASAVGGSKSDFISGQHFCSRLSDATGPYTANCNSSTCNRYTPGWGTFYLDALAQLLWSRGQYGQQIAGYWYSARNYPTGILQLAGIGGYRHEWDMSSTRQYLNLAKLLSYVEVDNDSNFRVYKNWYELAVEAGHDNVGLMPTIAGTKPNSYDGSAIENSIEHYLPVSIHGEVGVSSSDAVTISNRVQRIRPRCYTSPVFNPSVLGKTYGYEKETCVQVRDGYVDFYIPPFGYKVDNYRPIIKFISPAIHDYDLTTSQLIVDFEPGVDYATYVAGEAVQVTAMYRSSGKIVKHEQMIYESTNPASNSKYGSRLTGLCVGDTLEFYSPNPTSPLPLDKIRLICISCEAGGGDLVDALEDFPEQADGLIPQAKAILHNSDRAVFLLPEGPNKSLVVDYIQEFGMAHPFRLSTSAVIAPGTCEVRKVQNAVTSVVTAEIDRGSGRITVPIDWSGDANLFVEAQVYDYTPKVRIGDAQIVRQVQDEVVSSAWASYPINTMPVLGIGAVVDEYDVEYTADDSVEGLYMHYDSGIQPVVDAVDEYIKLSPNYFGIQGKVGLAWDREGIGNSLASSFYFIGAGLQLGITNPITSRLVAADVAQAFVDVTIHDIEVYENSYYWHRFDQPEPSSTSQLVETAPLTLYGAIGPATITDKARLTETAISLPISGKRVIVGETTRLQVSADVTSLVKLMLDQTHIHDQALYIWFGFEATEPSFQGLASSFLKSISLDYTGPRLDEVDVVTYISYFGTLSLSNLMIRLNPAACDNYDTWHYTDGAAHGPALN